MKEALKRLIKGGPLEGIARKIAGAPANDDFHSSQYWEKRYRLNGSSGAGSYGRLANFKAEVLNAFIASERVQSVIEFGCGDGNQLSLAFYPDYLGLDVSEYVIDHCRNRFKTDGKKRFAHMSRYSGEVAEAALSLDVIYHLVEDGIYHQYMRTLFDAGRRFVVIYSSNSEDLNGDQSVHVRHRKFSDWVDRNGNGTWLLHKHIPNAFPFDPDDPDNTSSADFFIYQRRAT